MKLFIHEQPNIPFYTEMTALLNYTAGVDTSVGSASCSHEQLQEYPTLNTLRL